MVPAAIDPEVIAAGSTPVDGHTRRRPSSTDPLVTQRANQELGNDNGPVYDEAMIRVTRCATLCVDIAPL